MISPLFGVQTALALENRSKSLTCVDIQCATTESSIGIDRHDAKQTGNKGRNETHLADLTLFDLGLLYTFLFSSGLFSRGVEPFLLYTYRRRIVTGVHVLVFVA